MIWVNRDMGCVQPKLRNNIFDLKKCSICSQKFNIFQSIKGLSCGHVFHRVCIQSWLRSNSICPLCRKKLD